jgi:hypothetical protein
MIPTSETGPDGGHSLYCLSDVDGCLITEDLYWDFSAAMQAAVEQSGTHEVWTEQVLVVGFPPLPGGASPQQFRRWGRWPRSSCERWSFPPPRGRP